MGKKTDKKAREANRPLILTYGDYTLDQEKFDKLLSVANKQEQTTLKVLHNAVVKCINDLNASSSSVSVKDWEKTRNSYEQYSNELHLKYFPPAPAENVPVIKTILDVVSKINEMGYRLSKSTAYMHGEKGLLRPDPEGIFTQDIIDKYISQANLKKKDGSKRGKLEKINAERQTAETRRINALAQREELRLQLMQGQYIPKESMERELSYRLAVFKMDGEASCRTKAGARINVIVAGLEDQMLAWTREKYPEQIGPVSEAVKAAIGFMREKIPDVIEFDLSEFAAWLNRYAADREFTVPVPAAEEDLPGLEDGEENSEEVNGE